MKTELKVGLFAIVVILILSYMTFKVSGLGVAWKKGYRLYVTFDNVSGLDEKSRVKVAGVDSGAVEKIQLKEGKAEITLLIYPDVKIYEDAKASLRVAGLLGDRYLSLSAGSPASPLLKDGDRIKNTETPIDIDALANELTSAATYISDLAETLQDIFGKSEREAIKESIHNLRTITRNFNEILKEDREPLHNMLVKLENFSESLSDKGPGLIDDLSKVARDLKEVVEENRYAFNESMENIHKVSKSASNIAQRIEEGEGTLGKLVKDDRLYDSFSSIAQKIERGEGTLGKLIKDEKLYDSFSKVAEGAGKSFDVVENLRTFMDFRTEYLTKEGEWKGYFDLTLQPRKDKYYILGVVTDPMGSSEITEKVVDGVKTREEEIKTKVEFTAQFAKRFKDFALRIGMIENTFGLGVDYFLSDDKAKVSFNIWDFGADEAKADKAHIKIGLDYRIFKYIFVSGGIDNLLNSRRRGIYIGGGLKFEDEDFKYIFGSSPKIPSQ
jgi:phospholipid/cholesterol/gamma-HCH transport system substrate-binding protein